MNSPFEAAEQVRHRVATDHAVLRSICRVLDAAAKAAVYDERQRPFVRDMLCSLCEEIELHLEFEESVLVPLLLAADAWGEVRVAELERSHDDLRAISSALVEDIMAGRTMSELTSEISEFSSRLEQAIAYEQDHLLSDEALGERVISTDQTDG